MSDAVRWFLALSAAASLAACQTAEDDDDATTPEGDDDATVDPTPLPITVADGEYGLWNAYVFPSGDYVIEPRGSLTVASQAISGQIEWNVYATVDDYYAGTRQCTYLETVAAAPDPTIPANTGCIDCGVYYAVTLTPASTQECDQAAVDAVKNGNGANPDDHDTWGVSSLADGNWPAAWTEIDSWESQRKPWLEAHDASYAIWSREWHSDKGAYLPMWALYDPEIATIAP
jgi:hypothetical protein